MELGKAFTLSTLGLKAQDARMKVIAENLANANTVSGSDGADPYRRKIVAFKQMVDEDSGIKGVAVSGILGDKSDFPTKYDPGNPSANSEGFVRTPNVNPLIEVMDMRDAQRSYEANLTMMEASKAMLQKTIDLLK
ncbi:MAG TPA: flagellar basal body rod protein FlgC [Rhodospirillaceae bacterium]|nr:MAG: flagellar basal body rod protein FlgC [Alphaproteobacteria bacterium GWF2_58_20]HAU28940.1 flagellar basal body rod protein FlgC [Rhodospirillaceae bacterium]